MLKLALERQKKEPFGSLKKLYEVREMIILLLIIASAVIGIFIIIAWQNIVRNFADRGWFWVRVPEMTYLAITKDRVVHRILVACPEDVWNLIKNCEGDTCGPDDPRIERVYKGLIWIGPPWIYKVYEWYETREDEINPAVPALHSVDLAEQVLSYKSITEIPDPENPECQNSVPNYKTADGIEAKSKLTFFTVVHDPVKALFAIRYRKSANLNKILPVWREVVSAFEFFEYDKVLSGEEDVQKMMARKLAEINKNLRLALGTSIIVSNLEVRISDPKNLPLGSIAAMIYKDWGTWVKDVAVEDFDAAEEKVETALQQILISATEAIQKKQQALGDKAAKITVSEGEAQSLKNLMAAIGSGDEGRLILSLQTFQKMGEQGNMIFSFPEISRLAESIFAAFGKEGAK
jgi:hypothetical protein